MNIWEKLGIAAGGDGSGNFNHDGRPGQVGGSQPNDGGKSTAEFDKPDYSKGNPNSPEAFGDRPLGLMRNNPAIPTPQPILDVLGRWGFEQIADEDSGNGPINRWRDALGNVLEINPRMGEGTTWNYDGVNKRGSGKGVDELADFLLRKKNPNTFGYHNPHDAVSAAGSAFKLSDLLKIHSEEE